MKEATGELSTTVIAIVAIAAIMAIFTAFLLPTLRAQIALGQACNSGPGFKTTNDDGSTIDCTGTVTTDSGTTNKDNANLIGNRSWTCTYKPKNGGTSSKTCHD